GVLDRVVALDEPAVLRAEGTGQPVVAQHRRVVDDGPRSTRRQLPGGHRLDGAHHPVELVAQVDVDRQQGALPLRARRRHRLLRLLPRRARTGGLVEHQLRFRVPGGRTPPPATSAAASCSAVSATRWVNGPVETRATPSCSSSRVGSEAPGTAITESLRGPSPSTRASISSRATTPGTNTTGAPASRNARPRRTASATSDARSAPRSARMKASVRAFSTKSTPASRPARSTASTATTASSRDFIWSSKLPPTAPASIARRAVSPASP